MLSFWERESFLDYDCIVIGSGIVGLSTAASLIEQKPSLRIAILERGILPAGASTRNAGFACFGSPSELLADIKADGHESMLSLVEQRWKGLQRLRTRLTDEQLGFEQRGGYELLRENELHVLDSIAELNELLRPVFNDTVFFDASAEIEEMGFDTEQVKGLIFSPFEGQVDTGLMMRNLINYVGKKGVQIITGCHVTNLDDSDTGVTIMAQEAEPGRLLHFSARQVVVCTNAFAKELLPTLEVTPGRGQVLITHPVMHLPFKGIFHFDQGYYYFRNVGERVLFGGGRNLDFAGEESTDMKQNDMIMERLLAYLREIILPGRAVEIDMQWSGIMAFGPERKPIVKRISPDIVAGLRMHGMGVALGSQVGDQLADLLHDSF
jgi:glycine/D-amino acid oxidase-like deaminating enzyme